VIAVVKTRALNVGFERCFWSTHVLNSTFINFTTFKEKLAIFF
jgi:hypothetical protein